MKARKFKFPAAALAMALACAAFAGCGHKEAENARDEHGEITPDHTVSLYHKNRGLLLPSQIRTGLGVTLIEVEERSFPRQWTWNAQVFQPATSRVPALASVLLRTNEAARLSVGEHFDCKGPEDRSMGPARLARLDRTFSSAVHVEAIFEMAATTPPLRIGAGLTLRIGNPSAAAAVAIPASALIRGVQEDFVYVESGEHLVRTRVSAGVTHDGWIEITEGLLSGDKVVATAAHDLWMIELLALRGGSPCCPVPKKDKT